MSYSLGEIPTSPTFGCLVVSVSYSRRGSIYESLRVEKMRAYLLVIHLTPRHIEYSITPHE
jgi:hypothetical protein